MRQAVGLAVMGALAAGVVAYFDGADRTLAVHAYLLFAGAVFAAAAARLAPPPGEGSRWSLRLRRRRRRSPPEELARLEAQVALASLGGVAFHQRLRPLLQELAVERLRRRGLELEGAADLLGPDAWELLRPDRPDPADRDAPGVPAARLAAAVAAIERL